MTLNFGGYKEMKGQMLFDPENRIVKRCALGMDMEGTGQRQAALKIFHKAWEEAGNSFEKLVAAHYMGRLQNSVREKLKWDQIALYHALQAGDKMKGTLPSLYLNVGKCYEDMNDFGKAGEYYDRGLSLTPFLSDDGYGRMIKGGLKNGLKRISILI